MEIEFDDEGGYSEMWSTPNPTTTLTVVRGDAEVRIRIQTQHAHGEMGLGVGLDAAQAREVSELLLAHATLLADAGDEEENE